MVPLERFAPSETRIRRPGRVLVVDDNLPVAEAMRRDLSDEHEVVVVVEAAAALARLRRRERYDVVLCELTMPAMDGIELHRRLRASHAEMADRMVFMTGEGTTSRIEAFLRRVPNLLLEKPVHLGGLRALIERRIGGVAHAVSA